MAPRAETEDGAHLSSIRSKFFNDFSRARAYVQSVKNDAADNIVVTVQCAKDGPQGDSVVSRLEVVEVGTDDDGEAITSCIVIPMAADAAPRPDAKKKRGPKAAQTALRALAEAINEAGEPAPLSSHIPATVKVISIDRWREYAYKRGISTSDEPRARQKAFKTATEYLIAENRVAVWEDHVWLCGP